MTSCFIDSIGDFETNIWIVFINLKSCFQSENDEMSFSAPIPLQKNGYDL